MKMRLSRKTFIKRLTHHFHTYAKGLVGLSIAEWTPVVLPSYQCICRNIFEPHGHKHKYPLSQQWSTNGPTEAARFSACWTSCRQWTLWKCGFASLVWTFLLNRDAYITDSTSIWKRSWNKNCRWAGYLFILTIIPHVQCQIYCSFKNKCRISM